MEIAIKTWLGKLNPGLPLPDLDGYLRAIGLKVLPITSDQVVAAIEPEPATRDPSDRLLLAVCLVVDLRLVTVDRALFDHRLAMKVWRIRRVRTGSHPRVRDSMRTAQTRSRHDPPVS